MRPGMTLAMRPAEMEGTFISRAVTMEIPGLGMAATTLHVMFQGVSAVLMTISNREASKQHKEPGGASTNAMKFAGMGTTLNSTTAMMATWLTEMDVTLTVR